MNKLLLAAALVAALASGAMAEGDDDSGGVYNSSPIDSTAPSKAAKVGCGNDPLFDEQYYLAHNPDVAAAVKKGDYKTGCDHYQQWGYKENRQTHGDDTTASNTPDKCTPPEGFDANYYASQGTPGTDQLLAYWNDKKDTEVHLCSGPCDFNTWLCKHYNKWGQGEGRAINAAQAACTGLSDVSSRCGSDFDTAFYLQSSPDVAAVMGKYTCAKRTFTDACSHYLLYGQYEMNSLGHIRLTHAGQKDPGDNNLSDADIARLKADVAFWGKDTYFGDLPLMKQPLGCHIPGTPKDPFSPGGARDCSQAEVDAYNAGGKPMTCDQNSTPINLGNGKVLCGQNMYGAVGLDGDPAIKAQAADIKAYLVSRKMTPEAAEYALHTLAPCNLQGVVCSAQNLVSTAMPGLTPGQSNDPQFNYMNWFMFDLLYGGYANGQTTAAAPKMCDKTSSSYKDYCKPVVVASNTPTTTHTPEVVGSTCGIAGKPACTTCRNANATPFSPLNPNPPPVCPAGVNGLTGY